MSYWVWTHQLIGRPQLKIAAQHRVTHTNTCLLNQTCSLAGKIFRFIETCSKRRLPVPSVEHQKTWSNYVRTPIYDYQPACKTAARQHLAFSSQTQNFPETNPFKEISDVFGKSLLGAAQYPNIPFPDDRWPTPETLFLLVLLRVIHHFRNGSQMRFLCLPCPEFRCPESAAIR